MFIHELLRINIERTFVEVTPSVVSIERLIKSNNIIADYDKEKSTMEKGLPSGYTIENILSLAEKYVYVVFNNDISIVEFDIIGSRVKGTYRKDSDLDIKLLYSGDYREDDVFNALNNVDNTLFIDGIRVDFFPVKANY